MAANKTMRLGGSGGEPTKKPAAVDGKPAMQAVAGEPARNAVGGEPSRRTAAVAREPARRAEAGEGSKQAAEQCVYFGSAKGCRFGAVCRYKHQNPAFRVKEDLEQKDFPATKNYRREGTEQKEGNAQDLTD
eukprot:16433335-Heterocapsa_arctica.AAC.1